MSEHKVKSQVRPETNIRSIDGLAQGIGGKADKTVGLVKLSATADLPAATAVPAGTLVFDTTAAKLKISVSGSWTEI